MKPIIIVAIDALEYELVQKFDCKNLRQQTYGKTDISEFSEPRTMVLWSSFLTGENKEQEVLALGKKGMWDFQLTKDKTFLSHFDNSVVIDLPAYSYEKETHDNERRLLKQFFEAQTSEEREKIRQEYNDNSFAHHRKIRERFLKVLEENHDLVIGYFPVADVIGHLNFGNPTMIRMIYQDLDEIVEKTTKKDAYLLVLSDHGMKAVGQFGDHNEYGFWSTNFAQTTNQPRITDFGRILQDLEQGNE